MLNFIKHIIKLDFVKHGINDGKWTSYHSGGNVITNIITGMARTIREYLIFRHIM